MLLRRIRGAAQNNVMASSLAALKVILLITFGTLATTRADVTEGFGLAQAPHPQRAYSGITFRLTRSGEITDKDGNHFSINAYQTSTGASVSVTHHDFESQVKAQAYFEKWLATVKKVDCRSEKKDSEGKVLSVRAQVVVPSSQGGGDLAAVAWTQGGHFFEIWSTSLEAVLTLEKKYLN